MAKVISNSVTLSMLVQGKDAYDVSVSSDNIVFTRGAASTVSVDISVSAGGKSVPVGSRPSGFTVKTGTAPAYCRISQTATSANVTRINVAYDGKGGIDWPLQINIILPDGSSQKRVLRILTIADGVSPVTMTVSPQEVYFVEGQKARAFVSVDMYRGDSRLACQDEWVAATLSEDRNLAANLYWSFRQGTKDDPAQFQFILDYSGSGPVDIQTVVKGSLSDGTSRVAPIHFRTIPRDRSFMPTRIRLWQSVPVDSVLTPGCDDGDEWTDIVFIRNDDGSDSYWKCVRRCVRKAATLPGDNLYSGFLQAASSYEIVATDVMLARNAVIQLLQGNSIQLRDRSGRLVGEITGTEDGDLGYPVWVGNRNSNGDGRPLPLWAVSPLGKHFIGGTEGQRIELDPATRSMYVYDVSGSLVAIHSGDHLDPDKAVPGVSGSAADNASCSAAFKTVTTQERSSRSLLIEHSAGVSSGGALEVSVPSYVLTAMRNGTLPTSDVQIISKQPHTDATLRLTVEVAGKVQLSEILGHANTSSVTGGSQSKVTTDAASFNVRIQKGDSYRVEVSLDTYITGGNGNGGTVSATAAADARVTAECVAECYNATYAANGFILSLNSRNYIYALFDRSGVLRLRAVSAGKTIFSS